MSLWGPTMPIQWRGCRPGPEAAKADMSPHPHPVWRPARRAEAHSTSSPMLRTRPTRSGVFELSSAARHLGFPPPAPVLVLPNAAAGLAKHPTRLPTSRLSTATILIVTQSRHSARSSPFHLPSRFGPGPRAVVSHMQPRSLHTASGIPRRRRRRLWLF